MSTEFVSILPPPGPAVLKYLSHRSTPLTSAPPASTNNGVGVSGNTPGTIPQLFADAFSIREQVYVHEQHVPLENEIDADDPRSWHWVVYASVGSKSGSPTVISGGFGGSSTSAGGTMQDSSQSDAPAGSRLPVGTIRLVPPPHPPHPAEASDASPTTPSSSHPDTTPLVPSSAHPSEAFVKLTRLAVLPAYRGFGLAKLLVQTALEYAAQNPEIIAPAPTAAAREAAKLELEDGADAVPRAGGDTEQGRIEGVGQGSMEEQRKERRAEVTLAAEGWQGLVLVHAQVSALRFWESLGWKRDQALGEWDEEGIAHVGAWRRVVVRRKSVV